MLERFFSPENPWPTGAKSPLNVSCGYGARPDYKIPDDQAQWDNLTLPRLHKFKNKAILADLVTTPSAVDTGHKTGANVLYGDGSAVWIARDVFNYNLAKCPTIDPSANGQQDLIWQQFDLKAAIPQ